MTTIKATVRNGRIEVDEPINLPDGTQVTIALLDLPERVGGRIQDLPESPDAVKDWVGWYDSLEPLEFTAERRLALDTARREQREFELEQWEKRSRQIEAHFP